MLPKRTGKEHKNGNTPPVLGVPLINSPVQAHPPLNDSLGPNATDGVLASALGPVTYLLGT
jgi:hypothetical protein